MIVVQAPARSLYNILRHWRSVGLRQLAVTEFDQDLLLDPAEVSRLRQEKLDRLAEQARECQKCSLFEHRKSVFFATGSPMATLMFVSDSPELEDSQPGSPFIGETAELFERILAKMGLHQDQVYTTQILKCATKFANKHDEKYGDSCMKSFLLQQIDVLRPRAICTMGSFATSVLLESQEPISRLRGKAVAWNGTTVFPTFHPAYLLKKKTARIAAWEDMQAIKAHLQSSLH